MPPALSPQTVCDCPVSDVQVRKLSLRTGDLILVSTKQVDVILRPSHGDSLVPQAPEEQAQHFAGLLAGGICSQVSDTSVLDLLRSKESKQVRAVVHGKEHNWGANLDRALDDGLARVDFGLAKLEAAALAT